MKRARELGWWVLAGPAVLAVVVLGGGYYAFLTLKVAGFLLSV